MGASCTAVDHFGNYLTYNGSAWSTPTLLDLLGNLNAVSCFSGTSCVAVDSNGNAFLFDVVPATADSSTADSHPDARRPAAAHFCAAHRTCEPVSSPMEPTKTSTTPTSSPVEPAPVSSPSGAHRRRVRPHREPRPEPHRCPIPDGGAIPDGDHADIGTGGAGSRLCSFREFTNPFSIGEFTDVGPGHTWNHEAKLNVFCLSLDRRCGLNDGGPQTSCRNLSNTACRSWSYVDFEISG